MLQLARLDPESGLPNPQPVDLAALAEATCADLGPLILDKNLDFALDAAPGCIVVGQAEWLGVLLRNLIDNAIRYTPAGGRCASAFPALTGIVGFASATAVRAFRRTSGMPYCAVF